MEMEKGQPSSWAIGRVVLYLDRFDDLENNKSGSISSSSATHFLDAARLQSLKLLLVWDCCTYVPNY